MSNWTVPRLVFDDAVLEFPNFPAIMPIFEKSAPTVLEFHRDFDTWPHAIDLLIGINGAGDTDIINRPTSVEAMTREQLAFYGFKPDRNFARQNYPLSMRFSRVSDLEDVSEVRGHALTVDARIQSHVVPYVFATFTHAGGTIDLNALGYTQNGLLLPHPWPRVLNCYRLVSDSDDVIRFPRGPVPGTTRGRQHTISNNGTMVFPASMDSQMTVNGEIPRPAGDYRIEIGHVEPHPTRSVNGFSSMPFGPERWPTAATP